MPRKISGDAGTTYQFAGWYLNPGYSGTRYDAGESVTLDEDAVKEGKVDLYAKWNTFHTVTVHDYDGNGGTTQQSIQEGKYYQQPTHSNPSGKVFEGWYLDAGFVKKAVFPLLVNSPVDIYAKWKIEPAVLKDGDDFNVALKQLSGQSSAKFFTTNTTIKGIKRSYSMPIEGTETVEIQRTGPDVYAWFDANEGYICYYTDALDIKASDCGYMFEYFNSLTDISGLEDWDVSNVTKMRSMFKGCSALEDLTSLSGWDLRNVSDMRSMFEGCSALEDLTPLSGWDVSKTKYMSYMFRDCKSLTNISGLSDWDVGKVTDMDSMFYNCDRLSDLSPLSSWDVGSVTDMQSMFYFCKALNDLSPLSSWDVGSVTDMQSMFCSCQDLTGLTGLEKRDVSKVTNMSYMFYKCFSLTDISSLSDWNVISVSDISYMFNGDNHISNASSLEPWGSKFTDLPKMDFHFSSIPNLPTWYRN